MPEIWDHLRVAMRCQSEASIQAGGRHMEHFVKCQCQCHRQTLKILKLCISTAYVDIN
jgi:hypothetical protein